MPSFIHLGAPGSLVATTLLHARLSLRRASIKLLHVKPFDICCVINNLYMQKAALCISTIRSLIVATRNYTHKHSSPLHYMCARSNNANLLMPFA